MADECTERRLLDKMEKDIKANCEVVKTKLDKSWFARILTILD